MKLHLPPAILLAAGESSRFYPLSSSNNKSFVELVGKPLIAHTLSSLERAGCSRAMIVVSPREYSEAQLSQLKEKFQLTIDLEFILQPEPLGEVHALKLALAQLADSNSPSEDKLLVFPAYQVAAGDLATMMMEQSRESGEEHSFSTYARGETQDSLNTSGWLLTTTLLQAIAQSSSTSLGDVISSMDEQRVQKILSDDSTIWCTYSWDLLAMVPTIMSMQSSNISENAQIASTAIIDDSAGPVIIDQYAQVKDFVKIIGPSYIGAGAVVREHSCILASSIEHNVLVGSYTEIKRSIILPGCTIHQSYCADSVLGEDTRVGAGLLTSNLRFDNQSVRVLIHDEVTQTHRRKLGVITGPGVKLGVRTTTMPGTIIGEATTVFPSLTIAHSHPARSIVQINSEL